MLRVSYQRFMNKIEDNIVTLNDDAPVDNSVINFGDIFDNSRNYSSTISDEINGESKCNLDDVEEHCNFSIIL